MKDIKIDLNEHSVTTGLVFTLLLVIGVFALLGGAVWFCYSIYADFPGFFTGNPWRPYLLKHGLIAVSIVKISLVVGAIFSETSQAGGVSKFISKFKKSGIVNFYKKGWEADKELLPPPVFLFGVVEMVLNTGMYLPSELNEVLILSVVSFASAFVFCLTILSIVNIVQTK